MATAASTPSGWASPKQHGHAVCQRLRPSAKAFSRHLHPSVPGALPPGLHTGQPGSRSSWTLTPNSRLQWKCRHQKRPLTYHWVVLHGQDCRASRPPELSIASQSAVERKESGTPFACEFEALDRAGHRGCRAAKVSPVHAARWTPPRNAGAPSTHSTSSRSSAPGPASNSASSWKATPYSSPYTLKEIPGRRRSPGSARWDPEVSHLPIRSGVIRSTTDERVNA